MLHQSSGGAVLEDLVVDREDSAGSRDKAAGVCRESVHTCDVDIILFEKSQDGVYSVRLLLAHSRESLKNCRVMLDVCFKNLLCSIKDRKFSRCGTGA